MTETTNYGLNKFEASDEFGIDSKAAFNENFDIIDANLGVPFYVTFENFGGMNWDDSGAKYPAQINVPYAYIKNAWLENKQLIGKWIDGYRHECIIMPCVRTPETVRSDVNPTFTFMGFSPMSLSSRGLTDGVYMVAAEISPEANNDAFMYVCEM